MLVGTRYMQANDFIPMLMNGQEPNGKINISLEEIKNLEALFDLVAEGIMITDLDHNIVLVNKKHVLLDFFAKEELMGTNILDVIQNGYYTELTSWMKSKSSLHMLVRARENRLVLITGKIVFQVQEGACGWLYTCRDIHDFQELKLILEHRAVMPTAFEAGMTKEQTDVVYRSDKMKRILDTVMRVSFADSPIFLNGESGVGKDVIAYTIHQISACEGEFVHVNCPAIPETLFESELFGYESGSFTGARKEGKKGLLECAHKGTIFLDEIGDLPLPMQSKLLQVLQTGKYRRVGGWQELNLQARVIASTNRDIRRMMADGRFRADLYYRLCVIPIIIPPLRERREDIVVLADHFLERLNIKYGVRRRIAQGLMEWMVNYEWPGNVRELKNLVERMFISATRDVLTLADVPLEENEKVITYATAKHNITLEEAQTRMEIMLIARALRENNNTRDAARELGIGQATLLRKARKYGINTSGRKNDK